MNATGGTEPDPDPGAAAAHEYFGRIEDAFLRLRGKAMLLSPEDWRLAEDWHRRGVPLALVLGTLEAVWAKRRARGGAASRVSSLRYFAPAVEAAWEEVLELGAPALGRRVERLDVDRALEHLLDRLPENLPGGEALRRDIAGLRGGAAEVVERRLAELESAFLADYGAGLEAGDRARMAAEVDEALTPLIARLSEAQREESRQRLGARWLHRRAGLPVLSLFVAPAPDGPAAEEEASGGR